jgi:hypothetical protein
MLKIINIDFEALSKKEISEVTHFKIDREAKEYEGCRYQINSHRFIQRTSKVTPKKIGQFVTLWKRNQHNITTPIVISDGFDFVVILCKKGSLSGRFLFPSEELLNRGILSGMNSNQSGKRGFRVYPDWDIPTSKQAIETQKWQVQFFSRSPLLKLPFNQENTLCK